MSRSKTQTQDKSIRNADNQEEVISPEVAEVISDLPNEQKRVILRALTIKQHYSGPLPDGDSIKIYNEVIPNGGDRLMSTVEKQLEHRIALEKIGIKRTFNQSSTGQWMGFLIAIVFGVISWDLAKNGHEVVASILGTVDIVALVSVFIIGNFKKDD